LTYTLAHPTSTGAPPSSNARSPQPVINIARYADADAKMKWKNA
jgi:hypothetical protein